MEKNGKAMETVERIGREQWEKNAKGEENDEKNNGKKEGLWHKTMEKNGKAMETVERIGRG